MRYFITGIVFLLVLISYSQEQNSNSLQTENRPHVLKTKDTLSLKDYFLKSRWDVNARSFYMQTNNEGDLKDDYALAAGAGIGMLTKSLYGFQIGLSGFFIYNVFSSQIDQPDPITGGTNRYELGLFDIVHPSYKTNMNRLEELYLKYNFSKSAITLGKMNLNTPFMNPQDGRMRPTFEEGVWMTINESEKLGINGGWIWSFAPRSTIQWFSLSNSIGLYPAGVNSDGSKSNYQTNIQGSSGIAIVNLYYKPIQNIKINVWDGFLENVMNTGLIEVSNEQKKANSKLYQGLLFLHQNAVNNGGNIDPSKTYMDKSAQSNAISAQVGIKNKRSNYSFNYTHITGDGRYLMPREWGKEPFYTFMPRERNEGFGNLHAFMVKSSFFFYHNKFKTGLAAGYYKLPDVKDYRLNKYGMPSYYQINYDASFSFDKFLKGMEIRFLAAYKINAGETYGNLKYVYNKVNLLNLNFIIDFKI